MLQVPKYKKESLKIGIIITRIGGIDGVALETEKWMKVLEELGHEIYILAGEITGKFKNSSLLSEIWLHHEDNLLAQEAIFFKQDKNEEELIDKLNKDTIFIEQNLLAWIKKNKIDVIVSENASSLPRHLALGLAIKNIIDRYAFPALVHDHDFAWERGSRYKTQYKNIKKIIDETYPLRNKSVRRAVINSAAKDRLKEKYGLNSIVVPNVMDFDKPFARLDSYNKSMLKDIGLNPEEIHLFQITRIVERKRIDTAIKLIKVLDDKRIKLVITGTTEDDDYLEHYKKMQDLISKLKVKKQIIFASEYFDAFRKISKNKQKIFSLEDAYCHAKACTYFSSYEGFGNAFVEAILARRPIFVNNYKPVFWPDIGSKGFELVMIENNKLTKKAVSQIRNIVYNEKLSKEIANHNYVLGKKYFSFSMLKKKLIKLFSF